MQRHNHVHVCVISVIHTYVYIEEDRSIDTPGPKTRRCGARRSASSCTMSGTTDTSTTGRVAEFVVQVVLSVALASAASNVITTGLCTRTSVD